MASTMAMTATTTRPIGELLREWRERRRLSQMALALEAEVSTRHLSFLETGRSLPSREMILRLAEHLAVPPRERNTLLLAAGYAPAYPERTLDDPALAAARGVIDQVLAGHEPYPALAIDRHWNLVAANRAVAPMLVGVAPDLLQPPVNVLRISLHLEGLAPRIANLADWRGHLLSRLEHEVELTADCALQALLDDLRAYPLPGRADSSRMNGTPSSPGIAGMAVPFMLETEQGLLSFISTTMVFGTAVDVTLSEMAIEAFFPADAVTTAALKGPSKGNAVDRSAEILRSAQDDKEQQGDRGCQDDW